MDDHLISRGGSHILNIVILKYTEFNIIIYTGQKLLPGQKPPDKKPPIKNSTSYVYIGIFAHILDLLYCLFMG